MERKLDRIPHKFNGEYWDALFVPPSDLTDYRKRDKDGDPERCVGDCNMPLGPSVKHRLTRKERVFRLDKTQTSEEMLDAALHEAHHAAFPFLNEEWVNDAITDIAKFLVKLGFTRKGTSDGG